MSIVYLCTNVRSTQQKIDIIRSWMARFAHHHRLQLISRFPIREIDSMSRSGVKTTHELFFGLRPKKNKLGCCRYRVGLRSTPTNDPATRSWMARFAHYHSLQLISRIPTREKHFLSRSGVKTTQELFFGQKKIPFVNIHS